MSDDEADPELLDLLRQSLGMGDSGPPPPLKLRVLEDAEFVYNNSMDVAIDMQGTKAAASSIYKSMQERGYGIQDWRSHELHPQSKDISTVEFVFLMDLLNFSFWSAASEFSERFAVEYCGKSWTGYWSLVAAIRRAIDEGIPITSPEFWTDEVKCSDEVLKKVFRSSTQEVMPMLDERIACLREAGKVLIDVCFACL